MNAQYPAIILKQIKAVQKEKEFCVFLPDPKNLLEIHFVLRGPRDPDHMEYSRGLYHGRLLLPPEYPYKPPHVQLLTPSGRFHVGQNICFSFTAFHPESYSPVVGLYGIIIGLQSLFTDYNQCAVGMITSVNLNQVKELAEKSRKYTCNECNLSHATLINRFFNEK